MPKWSLPTGTEVFCSIPMSLFSSCKCISYFSCYYAQTPDRKQQLTGRKSLFWLTVWGDTFLCVRKAAVHTASPRTRRELKEGRACLSNLKPRPWHPPTHTPSPSPDDSLSPVKLHLQIIPQPFKTAPQLGIKLSNTWTSGDILYWNCDKNISYDVFQKLQLSENIG